MITEDYVSFEVAKLLKEKGFDEACFRYAESKEIYESGDWMVANVTGGAVGVPTLQMAVKWLRDVHNLIISVEFTIHGWLCDIAKIVRDSSGFIVNINHGVGDDALPYCDEYEKSCETAIKYCLENLI